MNFRQRVRSHNNSCPLPLLLRLLRLLSLLLLLVVVAWTDPGLSGTQAGGGGAVRVVDAFHLILMAKRGSKGNLKRTLEEDYLTTSTQSKKTTAANKGQELTGVSLPSPGMLKGWEFGDRKTLVCANVENQFWGLQGDCPRCGFDLYKGDLIARGMGNDAGFEDLPRVACPTCATTYSFVTGKYGPPLKRTGLAGFVGNLAKSATQGDRPRNAEAFQITRDQDGRVYCRNRKKVTGKPL